MLEFLHRNRVVLASGFFLVMAAMLIMRTSAQRSRGDLPGYAVLEGLAPLQRVVRAVTRVVGQARDGVLDLLRARREVVRLRARVSGLEGEAARLAEAESENERLRELLGLRERLASAASASRVIGWDATGRSRTLVIDRGEAGGVRRDAATFVAQGIVGRVFQVSPHAARVLLVTDHNSGVDAVVQRSRARGIVEGTVGGGCGLKFVKRTEDVQVGDLVVTSGMDGIFPKGLAIGRVTAVDKRGQGLFQYAEVEPSAPIDHLEEVLVTNGAVEAGGPAAAAGE
jgi:rod shape-determining protein MreC